jgi:predicted RNase H-like HicB family nuclease
MALVRVIYHQEEGSWWAISPDMPGLIVAGDTAEEVRDLAVEALAEEGHTPEHLAADGSLVFPAPTRADFHGDLATSCAGVLILSRSKFEGNTLTDREPPMVAVGASATDR